MHHVGAGGLNRADFLAEAGEVCGQNGGSNEHVSHGCRLSGAPGDSKKADVWEPISVLGDLMAGLAIGWFG
jgi:hypothetical protein